MEPTQQPTQQQHDELLYGTDFTLIRLSHGQTTAKVLISAAGKQQTIVRHVPVEGLLETLARGLVDEVTGVATPAAASHVAVATRVTDPLAWKLNLFPDLTYALFEGAGGDFNIVVRGFEACTKILHWRPDRSRDAAAVPLAFKIPRCLWVVVWRKKKMVKAWLFTCDQWPSNVIDETNVLRPWGAGNVFERGEVCWGSTTGQSFGADGVNMVSSTFFGSIFNDHIPRIVLDPKHRVEGAFALGFSLKGLFDQTTTGQGEKVGVILPDPGHATTLRRVIQAAAAE